MKKLLFILFIGGIFSCSSNNKDEVKEGENRPGIQNVNGNIPDTTNAINLDNDKTDSSNKSDSSTSPNQ